MMVRLIGAKSLAELLLAEALARKNASHSRKPSAQTTQPTK